MDKGIESHNEYSIAMIALNHCRFYLIWLHFFILQSIFAPLLIQWLIVINRFKIAFTMILYWYVPLFLALYLFQFISLYLLVLLILILSGSRLDIFFSFGKKWIPCSHSAVPSFVNLFSSPPLFLSLFFIFYFSFLCMRYDMIQFHLVCFYSINNVLSYILKLIDCQILFLFKFTMN